MRARSLTVAAAVVGISVTVAVAALPSIPFAIESGSLHIAFDTATGVIAAVASVLLAGRFRMSGLLRDALAALSLGVFAATNLGVSAFPQALIHDLPAAWTWATLVGRLTGAVLFAAASLVGDRRTEVPKRLGLVLATTCTGSVATIAALMTAIGPALPAGVETFVSEPTGPPRIVGHPVVLATQLVSVVLFAVAAWGFTRRAEEVGDALLTWMGPAAALAAFARANYFLYPSLYSDFVYTGDLLRLGFYVLLTVGSVSEIETYWRAREQAAVLEERRRIARDLHDGLAQELAFVAAWGRRAARRPDEPFPAEIIATAAQRALDESRRAIAALSQPVDQTLTDALAQTADELSYREGVKIVLELQPRVETPPDVREELLRIAREALTNACRHARAQEIRVTLANRDGVRITVTDDGVGFEPTAPTPGFGVVGMRERAKALGAGLDIHSVPGEGTTVEIVL